MAKPSRPEPHPRKPQPVDEESCAEASTERMATGPGTPASSPGGGVHTRTAARRAARSRIANREEARGRGAPASSPGGGLRPASRGSAKPAPMTPGPANVSFRWPPSSSGAPAGSLDSLWQNPHGPNRTLENRNLLTKKVAPRPRQSGWPQVRARRPVLPVGAFTPAPLRDAQRDRASPIAKKRGDVERRSPTGIARERETSADDAEG